MIDWSVDWLIDIHLLIDWLIGLSIDINCLIDLLIACSILFILGTKRISPTTITIATKCNTTRHDIFVCLYQIKFTKADSKSVHLSWKPVIKSPHNIVYKVSFYNIQKQRLATETTQAVDFISSYNESFVNKIYYASIQVVVLQKDFEGPLYWIRLTTKQRKEMSLKSGFFNSIRS